MTTTVITAEEQRDLLASSARRVYVDCLTISHAKISPTIYVVNDTRPLVRNGITFQPFPFSVTAPNMDGESPPHASITFSLVDRQLLIALRAAQGFTPRPRIVYEAVDTANPNQCVASATLSFNGVTTQDLQSATINALAIGPYLDAQFPLPMFAPSNAAV